MIANAIKQKMVNGTSLFGEVNMIANAIKQKMVNGLSLYSEK